MELVNRLLIFDLKGPLGHFRKFYTNASSLTYAFPPRTVVTGLIAGLLGRERDAYYEEFGTDRCKVGISIQSAVKKIMQTVNYIRTKDNDGFGSFQGALKTFISRRLVSYPTLIEMVMPTENHKKITYRVYFSHSDDALMEELHARVKQGRFVYPPYLGLSELLAGVEFVAFIGKEHLRQISPKNLVELSSVCNLKIIEDLEFQEKYPSLQYVEEKMPLEFGKGREIRRHGNFLHEQKGRPVCAVLKTACLEIDYEGPDSITECITFLE